MAEMKQILLVANDGKGGVINHPAHFDYPPKKKMGDRWFFLTDRFRTLPSGDVAAVYTESGFKLNIEDFADLKKEDVAPELVSEAPTVSVDALKELEEILGEDSIFTPMIAEWHNRHLNEQVQ